MEMIERLAYYGVRVVIPIYIAQADEIHGLHFSQTQKGLIFTLWALVQTGVPVFSGGFADRYGYKRTISVSIAIKIAGYLLMATQREYHAFLFGCCVLALGTAGSDTPDVAQHHGGRTRRGLDVFLQGPVTRGEWKCSASATPR